MRSSRTWRWTAAVAALLVVALAGCASGPAAPAPTTAVRVLRVAALEDYSIDPAPLWFADAVARSSGGALVVRLTTECCGEGADRQTRLLAGVRSGRWQLGVTGPRDLEDAGARPMGALTAPRLIDTYAAEEAVLTSDVPSLVLPSAREAGVQGIALLPGLLRRPMGRDRALRAPVDWRGITFWSLPSRTSAAAIRALGATPQTGGLEDRDARLEAGRIGGTDNAVVWQAQGGHMQDAVITMNEALWPRIGVVVAAPALRLSTRERGWLTAAAAAVARRTGEAGRMDAAAAAPACSLGTRFVEASPAQLASTDRALAPVYAGLEANVATRTAIERIRALEPASPPREYDLPEGC